MILYLRVGFGDTEKLYGYCKKKNLRHTGRKWGHPKSLDLHLIQTCGVSMKEWKYSGNKDINIWKKKISSLIFLNDTDILGNYGQRMKSG